MSFKDGALRFLLRLTTWLTSDWCSCRKRGRTYTAEINWLYEGGWYRNTRCETCKKRVD